MKKYFLTFFLGILLLTALTLSSCSDQSDDWMDEDDDEDEKITTTAPGTNEHEHTVVIDSAVPATCTEDGLTEGKHCSDCGEVLVKQEAVPATTHEYVNGVCKYCGDKTSVGLEFTLNADGKSYYVWGIGSCTDTAIIIPSTYDGKPVTEIGLGAFDGCTSLESITIPNSVTSIDTRAFENCTSLTSITIPNSVTSIGSYAFDGCTSLTSITIPDSVTSIDGGAFYNTAYYKNATNWTDGVLYIGNHLIKANPDVISSDYTIKAGTKCIAYDAFSDCTSLTSITIPNSVTYIGGAAFYGCTSLTSITIPEGVTHIGAGAFQWCTSLENITIPDSVTTIGDYAFYCCTSLTSITIPDSVTSIGDNAFNATAYYKNATNWADGVLYIGNHLIKANPDVISSDYTIKAGTKCIAYVAFAGCTSLTSITIPNSVKSIGSLAFLHCTSLTSITIPDSLTDIGDHAFDGCTSLTSITIPNSVTSIGDYAFYCCTSLESITFNGTIAQWNAIEKYPTWNYDTGNYTIHCTDGDIAK